MTGRRLVTLALAAWSAAAPARAQTFWHHHLHPGGRVPLPYREPPYSAPQPPLPSGFVMTVVRGAETAPSPETMLERPRDIARRIVACWQPPFVAGDPVEITLRLQFARSGNIIGEPRVTYVSAPLEVREPVIASMRAGLQGCLPLRFTGSLGAAIAGYPFAIRFVAGRNGDRQPKENADGR